MRVKIMSKNRQLDDGEKFFLIIDDITEMVIGKSKIVFSKKDRTLYRANCNDEQSFNIQLSAEKGEIIDLTELYVEELDYITNHWEFI